MKYMGSKNRIAKYIIPKMFDGKSYTQYIEPFCGGMNMMDKVSGLPRIANDCNVYIMSMWDALINDCWQPPNNVTKEFYNSVKNNKESYPPHIVGWVGVAASFRGIFFSGYAGTCHTRRGLRNYYLESLRNCEKQIEKLVGVQTMYGEFWNVPICEGSLVYCDPPYFGTADYKTNFDHTKFWEWCVEISKKSTVFVSEYSFPKQFKQHVELVWEMEVKSSLGAVGVRGSSKKSVEKLFRIIN